jgi:hypothetical protein
MDFRDYFKFIKLDKKELNQYTKHMTHKQKRRVYMVRYKYKNKKKLDAYHKKYYEKNSERYKKYSMERYSKNKDEILKKKKERRFINKKPSRYVLVPESNNKELKSIIKKLKKSKNSGNLDLYINNNKNLNEK